jgi:hypothetical protein
MAKAKPIYLPLSSVSTMTSSLPPVRGPAHPRTCLPTSLHNRLSALPFDYRRVSTSSPARSQYNSRFGVYEKKQFKKRCYRRAKTVRPLGRANPYQAGLLLFSYYEIRNDCSCLDISGRRLLGLRVLVSISSEFDVREGG